MQRRWEDFDAYATEVRIDLGGGRIRSGSGYVIGPGRILTALHVLIGQSQTLSRDGKVVLPGAIEVRAHGDFIVQLDVNTDRAFDRVRAAADGDYRWQPATLLWPAENSVVPRFDIAVLQVELAKALKHIAAPPPILCLEPPDADVSCRATGFAKWTEVRTREGFELGNPCTVTGTLTTGAERYGSCRAFTVVNASPIKAEEWAGLSGSAFFDTEHRSLVGLASEVRSSATNNGLWVTRIADLKQADFPDFWAAAGLSLSRGVPVPVTRCSHLPPHEPRDNIHLFDRSPQIDTVLDVFQPPDQPLTDFDPARDPQLPLVFFISGRIGDLPAEMVRRLREELDKDWLGPRAGKPRAFDWRKNEEPDAAARGLNRDLVGHLTDSKRLVPLSTLSGNARGQDWMLEIDVSQADSRDVAALAKFLTLFAAFGPMVCPPALYVILFAGPSDTLAEQSDPIQQFLADISVELTPLANTLVLVQDIFLTNCEYTHIKPWVDVCDRYCEETAKHCDNYLHNLFKDTKPFPLLVIKESLSFPPAR